ncbi:MAG TPA: DUF6069 family protein [Mycobacteriales bacterium]|nr:DUF6069 family protein [Mycobacteriales bacterium]
MTAITARPLSTSTGTRALAAVAATAATSAIWAVTHAAGADFAITASGRTGTISLPFVVLVTLGFAALGWASLAVLERFTRSARRTWTVAAIAVTALSFFPIFLDGAAAGTRVGLCLIHLAVAAVLIPAFRASR